MKFYRLILEKEVFDAYVNMNKVFFNVDKDFGEIKFSEYREKASINFPQPEKIKNLLNGLYKLKVGDFLYLLTENEFCVAEVKEDAKFKSGFEIPVSIKILKREEVPESVLKTTKSRYIFQEVKNIDREKDLSDVDKVYPVPKKMELLAKNSKKASYITRKIKREVNENMGEIIIEVHPPEEIKNDIKINMKPKKKEEKLALMEGKKSYMDIMMSYQMKMTELFFKTWIEVLDNMMENLKEEK